MIANDSGLFCPLKERLVERNGPTQMGFFGSDHLSTIALVVLFREEHTLYDIKKIIRRSKSSSYQNNLKLKKSDSNILKILIELYN